MPWWGLAILLLGANFALWGVIGLVRLAESGTHRSRPAAARDGELTVADVAVLIPAHNEALVIGESLRSIMAPIAGFMPGRHAHKTPKMMGNHERTFAHVDRRAEAR